MQKCRGGFFVPRSVCINGIIDMEGIHLLGPRILSDTCCALFPKHPIIHNGCGYRNINGTKNVVLNVQNQAQFGITKILKI